MYYSRLIAERIVQGDKGQRNEETKALDKYFPCDSSIVCTAIGFISGRILRDDKGQRNGGNKRIEQLVSSFLKQCMYYSRLYCRDNCTG